MGKIYCICGKSSSGKDTVYKRLLADESLKLNQLVTYTTRPIREGEVNGREYFFIDAARFEQMVQNDELLEHAVYVGNYYGTPRKFVEDKLSAGESVFLDIEVQGARQVKEKMPDAIMIFLIPPSLGELKKRLESRGTETEETIKGRLARAREEYAEADFYDYIVVNDDIDSAANELLSILTAEKCRFAARRQMLQE